MFLKSDWKYCLVEEREILSGIEETGILSHVILPANTADTDQQMSAAVASAADQPILFLSIAYL